MLRPYSQQRPTLGVGRGQSRHTWLGAWPHPGACASVCDQPLLPPDPRRSSIPTVSLDSGHLLAVPCPIAAHGTEITSLHHVAETRRDGAWCDLQGGTSGVPEASTGAAPWVISTPSTHFILCSAQTDPPDGPTRSNSSFAVDVNRLCCSVHASLLRWTFQMEILLFVDPCLLAQSSFPGL